MGLNTSNIKWKIIPFILFLTMAMGSVHSSIAQESSFQNIMINQERLSAIDSDIYSSFNSRDPGDIVAEIDIWGSYCQGLTWDGENLWISIIGGEVFKIDTTDGTILESFPVPGYSCQGMAWDGENLFVCENGGGNLNPDFIYKMDPADGSVLSTLAMETRDWPHGITWDGQYIWTNNFMPSTITKIDYNNGDVLHTIPAPGEKSIGLTWDGEYLWANDMETDLLYCLNPVDGAVICTIPSPADHTYDMAYDGECLWVLASKELKLYRIDIGNSNGLEDPGQVKLSLTAYPNPYSETVTIDYQIYQASEVFISIKDIHGNLISILENQRRNTGNYQVLWNGKSNWNSVLPGGIYFCSLKTENAFKMVKIVKAE